ncbi:MULTISPECIES: hypothetical protein [unclassified Pseudomonas]|uniref:hypothetical protein n=1 Tax=unclassified Pseudomonas TaxID=196821 RepID=UPI001304A6B3|nr:MULTISPECIES: hypothetical protein [unclassified Pseudomonas]
MKNFLPPVTRASSPTYKKPRKCGAVVTQDRLFLGRARGKNIVLLATDVTADFFLATFAEGSAFASNAACPQRTKLLIGNSSPLSSI